MVKYDDTLGFQAITQGGDPANYLTSAGGTIDGSLLALNDGTEILNLITATGTLGANLDLYALRLDRDINNSADNAFNKIIIRSGGLMQAANTPTINADLYFGSSGLGDGEGLIWANNNTIQINGKIYASDVIKSGTAFLSVRSDQPQFTGDWIVNGGGLQFLTPGAGYALDAQGRRYAVTFLINHPRAQAGSAAIDALIDWVAQRRSGEKLPVLESD